MYLICLPNSVKANLVKANVIMAKNLNDVPLSKKGTTNPLTKKVNLVYDNVDQVLHCANAPSSKRAGLIVSPASAYLTNPYIESPGKPPNVSC
jgi:hypothetical protein